MKIEKTNLNSILQQQEEEFAIMSLNQSLIAKIEDVKFIGDKLEPDFILNNNGKIPKQRRRWRTGIPKLARAI